MPGLGALTALGWLRPGWYPRYCLLTYPQSMCWRFALRLHLANRRFNPLALHNARHYARDSDCTLANIEAHRGPRTRWLRQWNYLPDLRQYHLVLLGGSLIRRQ